MTAHVREERAETARVSETLLLTHLGDLFQLRQVRTGAKIPTRTPQKHDPYGTVGLG